MSFILDSECRVKVPSTPQDETRLRTTSSRKGLTCTKVETGVETTTFRITGQGAVPGVDLTALPKKNPEKPTKEVDTGVDDLAAAASALKEISQVLSRQRSNTVMGAMCSHKFDSVTAVAVKLNEQAALYREDIASREDLDLILPERMKGGKPQFSPSLTEEDVSRMIISRKREFVCTVEAMQKTLEVLRKTKKPKCFFQK